MISAPVAESARHAGGALLRLQSDDRLVTLVRDGNDRAFEALVHRYHAPLVRYSSRMLPADEAEEAVQHAFVNAYYAIRDSETPLLLRPWLYTVVRNKALNIMRDGQRATEPIGEGLEAADRPADVYDRRERLRHAIAAVNALPLRQRRAILLRELEGRSYDEIAGALTVSDGAVRQLLSRARATLRTAVTAITPPGLLVRLAGGGEGGRSLMERIAAAGAGGGGIAAAKLTAGLAIGGALLAGGGQAILHHRRAAHRPASARVERPLPAAQTADATPTGSHAATRASSATRRQTAAAARGGSPPAAHGRASASVGPGNGGSPGSRDRGGSGGGSSGHDGGGSHSGSGDAGGSTGSHDGGGSSGGGRSSDGGGSSGGGGSSDGGRSTTQPASTTSGDGGGDKVATTSTDGHGGDGPSPPTSGSDGTGSH